MADRRYSEDEVVAIFELATKAQAGGTKHLRSGDGMTLAGLQDIGREIGVPPELVAQAAKSLDRHGADSTRKLLGLPIGVGRSVDLGRTLSDGEWDQLVVILRDTFDATGRVEAQPGFRQWRNGNLRISIESTPSGDRIRMRTLRSRSMGLIAGGAAIMAISVFYAASMAIAGKLGTPESINLLIMMMFTGVGAAGWGAAVLPGWAKDRRRQMEELAARLTSGS